MCGIIVILQTSEEVTSARKRALGLSAKLRHRGPDWSGKCLLVSPRRSVSFCSFFNLNLKLCLMDDADDEVYFDFFIFNPLICYDSVRCV